MLIYRESMRWTFIGILVRISITLIMSFLPWYKIIFGEDVDLRPGNMNQVAQTYMGIMVFTFSIYLYIYIFFFFKLIFALLCLTILRHFFFFFALLCLTMLRHNGIYLFYFLHQHLRPLLRKKRRTKLIKLYE